ncbi:amidohydrolase family protein [Streptomyces sp. NPDC046984]|uniref:amidohydrolase family protein n=1 Tax=Streptomyces sp. NPDC046984 TaxID=3155138 RepID=UPI0033E53E98
MNNYVFRAARLFDGNMWTGPRALYVEREKIAKVTGVAEAESDPSVSEIIDFGESASVVPGLIDTHLHLAFDAGSDPVGTLTSSQDDAVSEQMRRAADTALSAGITTVRDLGDRAYLAVALGREFREHPGRGPHIVAAGPPLTPVGGHCHFLGGEAEGQDALRAAVRERKERGCGVVKIMASGGHMTPGSKPAYASQYTANELKAVVEEAHGLGLPVAAHVHGIDAIVDALDAGVDTLEHVSFMTLDGVAPNDVALAAVAGNSAFASVTMGLDPALPLPPPLAAELAKARAGYGALHQRGARVVVGTDAGVAPFKPHNVLPHAVAELLAVGFSADEALSAVTAVAAEAVGLGGRKGRLSVGFDADMLVVNGDPAQDPAALLDVAAVFRAGVRVR